MTSPETANWAPYGAGLLQGAHPREANKDAEVFHDARDSPMEAPMQLEAKDEMLE